MFATLLRLGALIAVPLVAAGAAAAQYDAPQDEAALILFSGPNYTGDAVNIFDPIHALPDIRFNDRARSVAVLSGAWEICEHSDFTGRCVFLRDDVSDLRYYDLGGDVSSVRPIYEYTDAEHGLMFVRDERGYIRYADAVRYGHDDYDYGYARTTRVEVYHYGYSPAYRSTVSARRCGAIMARVTRTPRYTSTPTGAAHRLASIAGSRTSAAFGSTTMSRP